MISRFGLYLWTCGPAFFKFSFPKLIEPGNLFTKWCFENTNHAWK